MLVATRVRQLSTGAFFGILLLLGAWLHRDYGVSWDETNNHLNGLVNLKFIASRLLPATHPIQSHPTFATTPDILDFPDAHHGPLFEMSAVVLNYLFTDHDSRSYFLLRHFLIFNIFTLGAWALYRLGTHWLRDWRWGLLGAALLVLSPRFFAEGFYNGKDIVYMAFFTLAMYTLLRLCQRPTVGRALLHGMATALAMDIRVQGLQLVLLTLVGLGLEKRWASEPLPGRLLLQVLLAYLGATTVGVLAGWPYLWAHSLPELLEVSTHAVRYPWGFTNFYMGQFLLVSELPWHYIPVWMGITIPLPFSLAALAGIGAALRYGWRRGRHALSTAAGRIGVLVLLWLLGPMLVVMLTHTVVYEGWRHLYFIYPALLLWAVQGIRHVVRLSRQAGWRRMAARAALGLGLLETGHTAVRIVQMHPHQNVYFSFLPGEVAEQLFERDYWGLGYRQGLEWVLAQDASPEVTVNVFWHYPLYNNSLIIKPQDRARIRYTPDGTARYYLAGYRWHPQSYLDSLGTEVHAIRAGGVKVLSVFRRP